MRAQRIRAHYERRIYPGLKSHEILDWSSPEAQRRRFEVLGRVLDAECRAESGIVPLAGPLLLDVGCGLTDLCSFLEEGYRGVRYVGVDLSERMLREALRRHPGRRVVQADVFGANPFLPRKFDVAFCSGTFNLRLDNNADFAVLALQRLADLVRGCVVANFLHVRAERKCDKCFYFDPGHLCEAALRTGGTVQIIDDYLQNDFTLVLRR
ncbi:MAG: hypothetical protein A3K19_26880 [Lentisphaerae bacterium RIFOXYB12_FULL_65_16]|nr:MAG: hypothetical protein A3K18_23855 [Lentisphaerae bacterium RIFOXYA12_64_32]OGV88024.1 MAG: hypothetical protein A3K19_26880 [Lentisphaerae bacterium RIFOXYB12_FULL_65_16]